MRSATPSQQDAPELCQIVVKNLSYFCNEGQLFSLFNEYSHVSSVTITRTDDVLNRRDAVVGVVTVTSQRQVEELFWLLNGQLFQGRNIK